MVLENVDDVCKSSCPTVEHYDRIFADNLIQGTPTRPTRSRSVWSSRQNSGSCIPSSRNSLRSSHIPFLEMTNGYSATRALRSICSIMRQTCDLMSSSATPRNSGRLEKRKPPTFPNFSRTSSLKVSLFPFKLDRLRLTLYQLPFSEAKSSKSLSRPPPTTGTPLASSSVRSRPLTAPMKSGRAVLWILR